MVYALIGLMGEKYGAPYRNYPFSSAEFGKSGIADWCGTCGSLIGAAMSLALFWGRKERDPMINELFRWYEITALPVFKPAPGSCKVDGPLPTSVSDSIICHISVARWCSKNDIPAGSPERSERCGRITADVARRTAEIINAKIDGTFKVTLTKSETQQSCIKEGCHGGKKEKWANPYLKGQMDCTPCHSGSKATQDKTRNHP